MKPNDLHNDWLKQRTLKQQSLKNNVFVVSAVLIIPIFMSTILGTAQCTYAQETSKQSTTSSQEKQDPKQAPKQAPSQSPNQTPNPEEVANMMAKMKQYTQPGEKHKTLEKFLGSWDIETRFVINGKKSAPEMGKVEFGWQIEGRWLKSNISGMVMGRPVEGFMLMGYDNFKQSFVATSIQNMDTAMLRFEGDLSREGKSLVMYGKMDEYLTGEHDKQVKYAFRFIDANTIIQEVHDLHIGETGSMVIEQTFKRRQ